MPRFGTIRRAGLVRYLKLLGFEGPFSGRKHQFMIKGETILRLPNPHRGNTIGKEFLSRILRQARIDRDTWESL